MARHFVSCLAFGWIMFPLGRLWAVLHAQA